MICVVFKAKYENSVGRYSIGTVSHNGQGNGNYQILGGVV